MSRMDGFERRKKQSKENILKAAEALLNKYGISRVSVNDIAREAGVSQVTIYNLFGDKDKLIYDCLQTIATKRIKQFHEILKTNKPYIEKVEDVVQHSIELNESNQVLEDTTIQNNPQWRQLVAWVMAQERKLFLELIKEGKKQGYLNPDISDGAIGFYFEVLIQGMTSDPELHAKAHHNPKLLHDLILIMLYGFGKIK